MAVIPSGSSVPRELPLVGRSRDLEVLHTLFGNPATFPPSIFITGESGVGKSRLAASVAAEARRRQWRVASGRAYPVETGVPYASLADAFLPILNEMDDATLAVLTRGAQADLRTLFPALGVASEDEIRVDHPHERRTRLFWTFAEMVKRLGRRTPLLIVLEDLHWADASSLGLLHFLARQLSDEPVRILGTYNTDFRHENEPLIGLERSLLSLRKLRVHPVHALDESGTADLVRQTFQGSGPAVDDFVRLLFGWTGGNPYFIEQTLDALVETGALYERDGTWLGWGTRQLKLPSTVRDAIAVRCRNLSMEARELSELLAVVGSRTSAKLLEQVSGLAPTQLVSAVDELIDRGLVDERQIDGEIVFEIRHAITRATWYHDLSQSRARLLHAAVAEGLEAVYGTESMNHADELAYHFSRAHVADGERAVHYLCVAGRRALHRHADQEAATYLATALTRLSAPDRDTSTEAPEPTVALNIEDLRRDLARAQARLGRYADACEIWRGMVEEAAQAGDVPGTVQALRHLGLVKLWSDDHESALEHLDAARTTLGGRDPALDAQLQMTAGVVLQGMGRPTESRERLQAALESATPLDDKGLLARIHRALALLHTWLGQADEARAHGWRAVELADQVGDRNVAFWGRWALASLEGLSGGPDAIVQLMSEARAVADELRSPVLRLWVHELAVEHSHFSGQWDRSIAEGERAIRMAESLNQRTLLVRLLVWTACTYLHRGDLERGRELVDRAWELIGEGDPKASRDVHATVPAYIGKVALAMAEQDYDDAIRWGSEGLSIADHSGYVIWVLHRLLPMVGEAYLRTGRLRELVEVTARIRREGERMDHKLALAWARTGDAMACWYGGQIQRARRLLSEAAESMEGIGIVYESARLRRQAAGRLAELGKPTEALAELKLAYGILSTLGAAPELEMARDQFRELGVRPPAPSGSPGATRLTKRETEIAQLVAARRSNKSVARTLGISPRTVTTHLTNIYRKLEIASRGELVDLVREARIPSSEVDWVGNG